MAGGRTFDVTVPALVSRAAVFSPAGRLLSVRLMISQFYSNELVLSKRIIWSLITRGTDVSLGARDTRSEPATVKPAVLCTAKRQTGKGWVPLDVNHPQRWLTDGNKAVFVFRLKFKESSTFWASVLLDKYRWFKAESLHCRYAAQLA